MDEASSGDSTPARSLRDRLEWAVATYRAHPELLLPFSVVAVLGVVLEVSLELLEELVDVGADLTVRIATDVYDVVLSESVPNELLSVLEEVLWLFVVGVAGNAFLTAVLASLAFGIAALVAADATANRTRSLTERTGVAARRLPALIAAGVVAAGLVGVGLALLVVPGLYLAMRVALAAPAIVLDDLGPIEGLRAGWKASDGRFFEVGALIAFVAIGGVLAALIPYVGVLVVAVGVVPLYALAVTRCYVSERDSRTAVE
ncbi:hypothetical protein [Natronolimnohabitans innermongolicus]|nr:hypothetical protein [Natronolimnohabitans innermongolicus]